VGYRVIKKCLVLIGSSPIEDFDSGECYTISPRVFESSSVILCYNIFALGDEHCNVDSHNKMGHCCFGRERPLPVWGEPKKAQETIRFPTFWIRPNSYPFFLVIYSSAWSLYDLDPLPQGHPDVDVNPKHRGNDLQD